MTDTPENNFVELVEWTLTRRTVRVKARDALHAVRRVQEGNGLREGAYHERVLLFLQGDDFTADEEEIAQRAKEEAERIQNLLQEEKP